MDKLLEEFIKDWRLKNNTKDAVYSSYHYDAMTEFAKHYHAEQLRLGGVGVTFICHDEDTYGKGARCSKMCVPCRGFNK